MIGLGDVVMILDLHRQGLSISAISREVGLDRKTIRRYLARGLEPPAYGPRQPRPTLLDPFTGYLRERVNAGAGTPAVAPKTEPSDDSLTDTSSDTSSDD